MRRISWLSLAAVAALYGQSIKTGPAAGSPAPDFSALDQAGIEASSGAACHAGASQPSHVLLAMGLPEAQASSALRLSLGWSTRDAELATAAEPSSAAGGAWLGLAARPWRAPCACAVFLRK